MSQLKHYGLSSEENAASSKKSKPIQKMDKIPDYEKLRLKTIEENKKRVDALGLKKMANSLTSSVPKQTKKRRNNNGQAKVLVGEDVEYKPSDEEDDPEFSNECAPDNSNANKKIIMASVQKKKSQSKTITSKPLDFSQKGAAASKELESFPDDSEHVTYSEEASLLSDTDDSEEESFSDDESPDETVDKNGRGENRIDEDWTIEGKILDLQLDEYNDVIGVNASKFSSQLGVIARDGNRLPLTYKDWRLVPHATKERIWTEVKGKTNLSGAYKSKCLTKVGKLWRDWKAKVKSTYYKPNKHDLKSLLKHCPERVEQDQWPALLKMWSSKKMKLRSKANQRNRRNQTMPHRTGRKGFGNVRAELREELHAEPSKLDVFLKTREAKEGKSVDETTLEILNKARELKEQLPESERNDVSKNDDIYLTLLGPEKSARLCTYGAGVCATSMENTPIQMPEEWKKFIDDTLKEKVDLFFDDMKSEIERKFVDMMEQRLSEFLEKNISTDMVYHRAKVSENTDMQTIEDHDIVYKELFDKDKTSDVVIVNEEFSCQNDGRHPSKVSGTQPNVDVDSSRFFGSKRCQISSADEEESNTVLNKRSKQK